MLPKVSSCNSNCNYRSKVDKGFVKVQAGQRVPTSQKLANGALISKVVKGYIKVHGCSKVL